MMGIVKAPTPLSTASLNYLQKIPAAEGNSSKIRQNVFGPEMTSVDELKEILGGFLTRKWKRKNAPRGFAEALQNASLGAATKTQQLFFTAGHECLLAYHLATTERTSHKAGPTTGDRRRVVIENLSVEDRRALVVHLERTRCHSSVTAAIHRISDKLQANLKSKLEWNDTAIKKK